MSGAIAAMMSLYPNLTARQAATLLTTYSADAGAPGQDPDFGYGTVDIGYALNYANPDYVDTAVSSQNFNAENGTVEFVVQNRSGRAVNDLTLLTSAGGERATWAVPALDPGARWSQIISVDQARLLSEGELTYTSQLRNPNGLVDQNPANNRKASVVFKASE
jgi:hypothetical protein